MNVRKVTNTDTWPIRNEVLRPGLPVSSCHFAEDKLPDAVHFSSFAGRQQTGVVSAYPIAFPIDDSLAECWQLRAMATIPAVRGQGHGAALIHTLEGYLLEKCAQWLWCNARQEAIGFYRKLGFVERGDEFEIAGIGPHCAMLKALEPVSARK